MGKSVLFAVGLSVAGVVFAVHYQQTWEKAEMHKGVIRDRQRVAAKKKFESERADARKDVCLEVEDNERRIIGSEARRGVERR